MSLVEGKRITFKRARPNPLFQDWLEELHEEAKQKKSKFESVLKEALTSISKYPLPLQSGAECAILKGFDKRLCLLLDKRLEAYKCFVNYVNPTSIHSVEDSSPFKQYCTTTATDQGTENNIENPSVEDNSNDVIQKTKKDKPYKPTFRSGGYAILMALLDQRTHSSQEMLNKDVLIDRAQKYCEESFVRPKPGTYYTAWSNMRRLIIKGYVKKTGNGNKKAQYSLTETGIAVANELVIDTKNKPSINDIIFNDQPNDAQTSPCIEPDVILLEECNSSSTCSKNVPQIECVRDLHTEDNLNCDLIVMDAGSFDIILLIDKNETSGWVISTFFLSLIYLQLLQFFIMCVYPVYLLICWDIKKFVGVCYGMLTS